MTQPTVCAVMLTADRPEMARRAVECFQKQTYQNALLSILDSSNNDLSRETLASFAAPLYYDGVLHIPATCKGLTIGELRNEAVEFCTECPIIIHWDDDDWSHPNRIAEQVALLQASGAECVGYNEMLFWREPWMGTEVNPSYESGLVSDPRKFPGEAWIYRNPDPRYCLGTSLCYWRSAWERRPFEATSQGEDVRWLMGVKRIGVPSVHLADLRMIARIHSGNTSNAYRPETMLKSSEWQRAPEWDEHCRNLMTL